ncbi:MAG: hypothetical protein KF784_13000 [Fimbriimonadaceae bacterium]|nr:hypothetical protein [Fimbriimonadaceae bacterium]
MLRFISAVTAVLLAAITSSQAFGRFGYTPNVRVPGFIVTTEGFNVDNPKADVFKFEAPSKMWRPVLTSDTSQTVLLSGVGRMPAKLRTDLWGMGFSLYFQYGFGLHLSTISKPYVSWAEGSAGPDIPTPPAKWVLISFREGQPPVLLSFYGKALSVKLSGRAGDWVLRSEEPYDGWVRVVAPFGFESRSASSAASLGELVATVKKHEAVMTGPIPKVTGVTTDDSLTSVTVNWEFDGPGAVVPSPAILAPLGGYPVTIHSRTTRLPGMDENGPITISDDPRIRMTFPVRRIPTGRGLSIGKSGEELIATASPIDIPSVFELALANLVGQREKVIRQGAGESLNAYLGGARYEIEPFTNQRLPYSPDGTGIDLAAAQALLMQSTMTPVQATSEPNSLLTSVLFRRDWATWTIWTPNPQISRRATALAALAAAICPEPERRLQAGLLQAGLASQRGLQVWRRRQSLDDGDPAQLLEVALGLRNSIFSGTAREPREDGFLKVLQSEIRIYGDIGLVTELKNRELVAKWDSPDGQPTTLVFASAYPIEINDGTNTSISRSEEALGFTVVRCAPVKAGPCELIITTPSWAKSLPANVAPPRYTEVMQ